MCNLNKMPNLKGEKTMFSLIQHKDSAYAIAHIERVVYTSSGPFETVSIHFTGKEDFEVLNFPDAGSGLAFYKECLDKIEGYYDIMSPV